MITSDDAPEEVFDAYVMFRKAHEREFDSGEYTASGVFYAGYVLAGECALDGAIQAGELSANAIGYLLSLVRMDIRKRQKALDQFATRTGQPPVEAAVIRQKMRGKQQFRRQVHRQLRELWEARDREQ
jgi:hypothetical protein